MTHILVCYSGRKQGGCFFPKYILLLWSLSKPRVMLIVPEPGVMRLLVSGGAVHFNQEGKPVILTSDFWGLWCVRNNSVFVCVFVRGHLSGGYYPPFTVRAEGRLPSHFGQHPNQTAQAISCRVSYTGRCLKTANVRIYVCMSDLHISPPPLSSSLSVSHTSTEHIANLDDHSSFPYWGLDENGFNNTCAWR